MTDRAEGPSPPWQTRRGFLAAVGVTSVAGLAPSAAAGPDADSLLAPGLTYLNTASLGPTTRSVLDRTLECWRQVESNPVQMAYGEGAAHLAADRTRTLAAALLGCTADEILITRSTTEALNSVAQGVQLRAGDRVLISDQEHEGGTAGWRYRARRDGAHLDVVPIAPTEHDPDAIVGRFAAAITDRTRVLSVSHVVASTGLRLPIAALAALARRHGILCVVDGAQAAGQIDVDVKALGCHAYATAGHKWLMGPKGTGLLFVSRDAPGVELVQWEDGRRFVGGSIGVGSLPLAVGLGAAIDTMRARGLGAVERHDTALRERAYAGLAAIPRLEVVGPPPGPHATAIVAARLPAAFDSALVRNVLRDKHRVMVKMVEKQWFNGIRLSPHVFNTDADVDAALAALRAELA